MVPVTPEGTGGVLGTETAAHATALVFDRDHPDRVADRSPAPYHYRLICRGALGNKQSSVNLREE